MSTKTCLTVLALALASVSRSASLAGPAFPLPARVWQHAAFRDMTSLIAKHLADEVLGFERSSTQETAATTPSYSVGIFSSSETHMLWEHHSAGSNSTPPVGTDSVYRIGSISKIITTFLLLIKSETSFEEPLTTFFPSLLSGHGRLDSDGPAWASITLADLATHMSGISRDVRLNDLALPWVMDQAAKFGLEPTPELPSSTKCDFFAESGTYIPCSDQELLHQLTGLRALFSTGITPAYSNLGFDILGLVLQRICGTDFESVLQSTLGDTLLLNATTSTTPELTSRSVLVQNASISGWLDDLRAQAPGAGLYSSLGDLTAIGRAILNSSLLPKSTTRRWLQPRAFTAALDSTVGLGWEISRIGSPTGRLVEVYAKDGNWGAYAGTLTIMPQYGVGFVILAAALPRPRAGELVSRTSKLMQNNSVGALERIAAEEASLRFDGLYQDLSGTNSSLVLTVDEKSGMQIERFVSRGVDVLSAMLEDATQNDGSRELHFVLQPTLADDSDKNQLTFTGTNEWFTGGDHYAAWMCVDAPTFKGIGMDHFVFNLDENTGSVVSIRASAWGLTLHKV